MLEADDTHTEVAWSEFRSQGEVQIVWDVLTFLDVPEEEIYRRHGDGFIWLVKAFQCLWAMTQEMAVVTEVPVHGKKRNKSGKERTVSNVIVVDLPKVYRPSVERDSTFKGVLTYRFPVVGHWRKLPATDKRPHIGRTWIKSYVKGPGEGEFVVKPRVLRIRKTGDDG